MRRRDTINIEKGATDRRLALKSWQKIVAMFSEDTGGYFCVLFISLPRVYPTAKHEQHKLITAITPRIISISTALLSNISSRTILLTGGTQFPPKRANRPPSERDQIS
jgi:hypothetical protein